MENKLLDTISRSLNLELPVLDTFEEYLDFVIPLVKPWGEDLREWENYMDVRWLEIRDEETFHETVLHIFREGGEYLISTDGNIAGGEWSILNNSNTMIVNRGRGSELFDLAFMNKDFFILKKHGNQKRIRQEKYFILGREGAVKGLEWRDIIELMFNQYRSNGRFIVMSTMLIVVMAIIILLSLI